MSASLGKVKHFLDISSITRAIRGLFMSGAAETVQQVHVPEIVTIGGINQIQPESKKGDDKDNDNDNDKDNDNDNARGDVNYDDVDGNNNYFIAETEH